MNFTAKANPKTAAQCDRVNEALGKSYVYLSNRFLAAVWQGNVLRVTDVPLPMQRAVRTEMACLKLALHAEEIDVALNEFDEMAPNEATLSAIKEAENPQNLEAYASVDEMAEAV